MKLSERAKLVGELDIPEDMKLKILGFSDEAVQTLLNHAAEWKRQEDFSANMSAAVQKLRASKYT